MLDKKDFEAIVGLVIDIVLGILKWLYLFMTIITIGLGTSFLIITIVKGAGLQNTLVAQLASYITFYSESEAYHLIESIGTTKVIISSLVYAFANGITYALIYYLLDKYIFIIKSLERRERPDKKKMDVVRKCVYASVFATIVNPLCITITFLLTKALGMANINLNGIIYLIMSFTVYLLYSNMYNLYNEKNTLSKEIDSLKGDITDKKIETIKKRRTTKKTTKK